MNITDAASLDDLRLTESLTRLAGAERTSTVALIVHLGEFDHRQLYRGAGFPSLFQYCVEVLRLSEDAASNRIAAARMARRFPVIVDLLTAGTLSPTTVRLISHHATPENGRALIDAAVGRTRRQVEEQLAWMFPKEGPRASVRPIGSPNAGANAPASRSSSSPGDGTLSFEAIESVGESAARGSRQRAGDAHGAQPASGCEPDGA